MYTSGTTGPPKGVQVTDRMLLASALGAVFASDASDGDVMFLWEPLCHIGGVQVLLLPLLRRVSVAMVERFSASRFWEQAASSGATHIHHLGGILPMLLSRPEQEQGTGHGVRVSWGGGMTAAVWQAAEERFGIRVRECYGMTEAASICTLNARGAEHGIGRPLPYFDLDLRDDDDRTVPDGCVGEIVLRPRLPGLVTPGYLDDPDATRSALRGGWWHTGDVGRVDDGDLHYVGRRSDSVRHRGENVSAWQVESVVNTHPAVAESALVGVPEPGGEQDLLLYVSLVDPLVGLSGDAAGDGQGVEHVLAHEPVGSVTVPVGDRGDDGCVLRRGVGELGGRVGAGEADVEVEEPGLRDQLDQPVVARGGVDEVMERVVGGDPVPDRRLLDSRRRGTDRRDLFGRSARAGPPAGPNSSPVRPAPRRSRRSPPCCARRRSSGAGAR